MYASGLEILTEAWIRDAPARRPPAMAALMKGPIALDLDCRSCSWPYELVLTLLSAWDGYDRDMSNEGFLLREEPWQT